METSPAFFEGKSERRVRVFLESGFCTGPSPGPSPSPGFAVCHSTTFGFVEVEQY